MNSNPKNPPEHSGDCAYYPIPSTGVGRLDRRGKTAVVVGAGPGGLTAALTIKEEGYENVIVFEKRSIFSRMNVVNLHPESLHIFERLNIVDRFLERASLIIDHRNHVFANGMELFNFHDQGHGVDVNPDPRSMSTMCSTASATKRSTASASPTSRTSSPPSPVNEASR